MPDLGLRFYVAPLKSGGFVAWALHPRDGLLREDGDTRDAAVVALRARWAIAEG